MLDHVMFVKEWVSHHDEMNYHFNQLDLCRHLRSGKVDFIGPINPTSKHSKDRYIITATDYLTHWVEATVVQECSIDTAASSFLRILSLDLDVLGS
jgi:hypothetical protein